MSGLRARLRGFPARSAAPASPVWLMGGMGVENVLRFARNMLLARLLAPEAFGVMAVVSSVALCFQTFTDIGVRQAVIQHERGGSRELLNGAFWLSLGRGAVLYALAFAAAPHVASFYALPELTAMIRVALAGLFCEALISPAAYAALKGLDYRRWALSSHLGGIGGVVAAVALAPFLPGAWPLVAGCLLEGVLRCGLSYALCPFAPGLGVDRAGFMDLLRFARGMFGLPVLVVVFMRADVFVLGKLATPAQLGLYSICIALAQTAFQLVERLLENLLMPRYALLHADTGSLNEAILRHTLRVAAWGAPAAACAACFGTWILALAYGWAYAPAAVVFAVMSAASLLRLTSMPLAVALFALGRPGLHRRFVVVRAACMLVLVYPAVLLFGFEGAAWAGLASMAAGYAFQCRTLARTTGLDLSRYVRALGLGFLTAVPVLAVRFVAPAGAQSLLPLAWAAPGLAVSALAAALLGWVGDRAGEGHMERPQTAGPEICLMGVDLESINRGVAALTASLIAGLARRAPGAWFTLAIPHRDAAPQTLLLDGKPLAVRVVNHRLSPRSAPRSHLAVVLGAALLAAVAPAGLRRRVIRACPTLEALDRADFIGDIRGGDSFSDIYGLRRLLIWSAPNAAALLLGKRVHYLPQTYGPFSSRPARLLARFLLRRAASVRARDETSRARALELLGPNAPRDAVGLCPDVAFTLEPREPDAARIEPPLPGDGARVVGLNVSGLLYNGGYSRDNMFALKCDYPEAMVRLARALLEREGTRVLFVPHEFAPPGHVGSDPDACRAVRDEVARRVGPRAARRLHLVLGDCDQSGIKALIGRCDAFAGARMHACIAALSQGISAVGVAYSRKFAGVFETVGCADLVLDARALETDELVREALARLAPEARDADLPRRVRAAAAAVGKMFDALAAPLAAAHGDGRGEGQDV